MATDGPLRVFSRLAQMWIALFLDIYLTGQATLSASRLPRAVSRLRTISQSIRLDRGESPKDSISLLSCFRVPLPPR
jgi:hypothetical protein